MPPDAAVDDLVVVGGGIVGLATACRILQLAPTPGARLDREGPRLGQHQSGHNCGVLHAGIYYAPGSMKARLCREGKAQLEAYCAEHGIEVVRVREARRRVGRARILRASSRSGRGRRRTARRSSCVGPERIAELEPHAVGVRALWSPSTGDRGLQPGGGAMAEDVRALGGTIDTGRRSTASRAPAGGSCCKRAIARS